VFILEVDLDTLHRRLDARPDSEWADGQPPPRDRITKEPIPTNGIAIDATAPIARVVDEILRRIAAPT
jgi:hypothetical protein